MDVEEIAIMPQGTASVRVAPAERRTQRSVRAWLEDAWRHGEVVDDEDGLEAPLPSQRRGRFATSSTEVVQ